MNVCGQTFVMIATVVYNEYYLVFPVLVLIESGYCNLFRLCVHVMHISGQHVFAAGVPTDMIDHDK